MSVAFIKPAKTQLIVANGTGRHAQAGLKRDSGAEEEESDAQLGKLPVNQKQQANLQVERGALLSYPTN